MGREGQDGSGVVVDECWFRGFRYPSPPTVADKANRPGGKQGQRRRLRHDVRSHVERQRLPTGVAARSFSSDRLN